ncbi:MAG: tRNA uridine-5-carboxymethylaminomethyl(34) synthesis GTPase MnmE [Deltaproteobacteria bacterium]|nr:tRNA uridine-5-carboxymethylaminomethyl(34) synthesis GTPase MnmE [Deltaproteobacteria bacterium]
MQVPLSDTIAAISTPQGQGAIGIVRISGPKACEILKPIFIRKNKGHLKPHRFIRGSIQEGKEILDDVLVAFMPEKKSYTGEELIEIQGHGSSFILSEILSLVIRKGARLAKPGEFTFRAFMNGKLDLAQAEAVVELMDAKSRKALQVCHQRLEGRFSKEILEMRDGLLELLVHTEASIDFSTEDIEVFSPPAMLEKLKYIQEKMNALLKTYEQGRFHLEGVRVAIVGSPNVGKSSLLNALLRYERAIVAEEAGTTRDTLEESIHYRGIELRMIDTAGIRQTNHAIEKIGIQRSVKKIREADIVLVVLDASQEPRAEDFEILDVIEQGGQKKKILVFNKMDLGLNIDSQAILGKFLSPHLFISALLRQGTEELLEILYREVIQGDLNSENILLTKLRHKDSLEKALGYVFSYEEGLAEKRSLEFLAVDLRSAIEELEMIIGKISLEDVYDRIFSSFCIGK